MGRARKKRNSAVPDDIDPPHETRHACRVEIENEEVREVRKGFICVHTAMLPVHTCTVVNFVKKSLTRFATCIYYGGHMNL